MDEYIIRQAATQIVKACKTGNCLGMREAAEKIEELPAADVVPVVRCRDCRHCLVEDREEKWCDGRGYPMRLVRPDDYCSYGERREAARWGSVSM